MNRRSVLGAAIGGASLVMATDKVFAEEHQHEHAASAHIALSEAARQCVSSSDACLSHCLQLLTQGDTSLAACAKSVYQMSAICEALARLASANSEHLAEFAKVAHAMCLDCEKECRKHENEHATCKACADSCAACAKECKKHMA
jgi:Cys-rich four helix bundle protein (predicted Tat secretion target)